MQVMLEDLLKSVWKNKQTNGREKQIDKLEYENQIHANKHHLQSLFSIA